MSDTLPCPFCDSTDISDGEVLTEKPSGMTVTQSMCQGCGALGPEAPLAEGEVDYGSIKATEAWNRRSDAAEPQQTQVAAKPKTQSCETCGGNDFDMPCAYPSENKQGCLRQKRLNHPLNRAADKVLDAGFPDNPTRYEQAVNDMILAVRAYVLREE